MPGLLPNANDPSALIPNPASPQVPGALGSLGGQATNLAGAVGLNTGASGGSDSGAPQLPESTTLSLSPVNLTPLQEIQDTYTFVNWPSMANTLLNYNQLFPYEFKIMAYESEHSNSMTQLANIYLQLPPMHISVSIPHAVNLSVTQNGFLEESNGAPIRNISMSGTTGIVNSDLAANAKTSVVTSVLDYAFKNTISAASSILSSANTAVQSVQRVAGSLLGGSSQAGYPVNTAISATSGLVRRTGFYAFHDMARFFETYMGFKKTSQGRVVRLVCCFHKDQMYYGVTLNNFNWQKQPGTLEYNYSITLTAWRLYNILDLGGAPPKQQLQSPATDPLSQVKNTLTSLLNAGTTLWNAGSIIMQGLKADAANVTQMLYDPLRSIILALKGSSGTPIAVSDLPARLLHRGKNAILATLQTQLQSNPTLASSIDSTALLAGLFGNPQSSGNPGAMGQSALSDSINEQAQNTLSSATTPPVTSSPAQQIFDNPVRYQDVLSQISVSDVQFSQSITQDIQTEVNRVNNLTLQQYQTMREGILTFSRLYAESVGAGDATYNRINGVAPPANTVNTLTIADIQMLGALNDVIIGFNNVIAIMSVTPATPSNDYFKYYVNYAINNGLALQDAASKFLIPFPQGSTLESLAIQYLGDIDRWPEIAAINALKEPYIDEDGFYVSLIGDGAGNTALVSSPQNLYVGDVVFLQSNNQVPKQFQIAQIKTFDANNTLIIFQYNDDLSAYTIDENAQIHAFLPDTVNSQKLLAIPSKGAPNTNVAIQIGPGVQDLAGLSQISKTDFLINSAGDWMVTPGGDLVLATGYTNLVQAANMKLYTPLGGLPIHPTFGNPAQPGANVADINASQTLQLLHQMFAADTRFTGVLAGQVVLKGPAEAISLLVGISGTNTNLPITALVPAG